MGTVCHVTYIRPSGRDVPPRDALCMGKHESCVPDPRTGERMKGKSVWPSASSTPLGSVFVEFFLKYNSSEFSLKEFPLRLEPRIFLFIDSVSI